MYRIFIVVSFCLAVVSSACAQRKEPIALIRETVLLDSLPSGSGMAVDGDSLYVVGDDATEIFKTGRQASLYYRPIPMNGVGHLYRMPAHRKRDFEAAFITDVDGHKALVAVPSGSVSPHRDSAFAMAISDPARQRSWNLRPLYNEICRRTGIRRSQLNIEGAFALEGWIYLLNRATNQIISVPEKQFISPESVSGAMEMRWQTIDLPLLNGVPAHFSDACVLDKHYVLFSASVEDAPGTASDGPLLGSYVGVMKLSGVRSFELAAIYPVAGTGGSGFTGKIEAVVPLEEKSDVFEVLAITDNDDGHSQLLRIVLPAQKN